MQKNAITLRKRIGSTVYVTKLYVKNDAAETMDDKILRLIRNDYNYSQKNGIMDLPQTGRLPERSSS
jgi:hypothetical protein